MTIEKQHEQMVRDAVTKLMEHFDSVRIFVSAHDGLESTTQSFTFGGGNLFAQQGQARLWIIEQDQYVKTIADKEQRNEHDSE